MEEFYVRVSYQYTATNPDELSANEGDIIKITSQYNEYWYSGELKGNKGLYPISYATRINSQLQYDIFVTSETYTAVGPNELSFNKGERVNVIEEVNKKWWMGEVDGKIGIFPNSHVEKLYDSICTDDDNFYENTPFYSNQDTLSVEAIYSFVARTSEELSFHEGSIITITKDIDNDWYEGTFEGKTGLFPKTYVQPFQDIYEVPPTPYARSVYPFVGESESELTFKEGEIILLRKRAGSQWLEGEIDGNIGLFPASFVDIEVELPPELDSNSSKALVDNAPQKVPLREGLRMRALYHFSALHPGDLALNEGDLMTIVKVVDENWIEGIVSSGVIGMCPSAYLAPEDNDSGQTSLCNELRAGIIARDSFSDQSLPLHLSSHSSSSSRDLSPAIEKGDDSTDSVFVPGGRYWDSRGSFNKPNPAPRPPQTKSQSTECFSFNGTDNNSSSRSLSQSNFTQTKSTSTSPNKSSIYAIPSKGLQHKATQFKGKSTSAMQSQNLNRTLSSGDGDSSLGDSSRSLIDMSVTHRASSFNLASPLVPLPPRRTSQLSSTDTSEEPIVPKRKAPPPPRKTLSSSDQKTSTLPRTSAKGKGFPSIEKGSEIYGSSTSIGSGGSTASDKSSKADNVCLKPASSLETSHKKRPPPPPTRYNIDKSNSFARSATISSFSRESYTQDKRSESNPGTRKARPYSVYYVGEDKSDCSKLNKSNSLEDIRQTSKLDHDKKEEVDKDEEDATDNLVHVNVALIPGVAELDKKIANAEHNLQVEWRACSGMKTILQMLVSDPDKHKEMEAKIIRSQQKIEEWTDITNGLKNDRTFLIKSYPMRKRIDDSIALLEADLQKQIRSQNSLQVLLNVVEDSRKEEVLDNLSVCETIITDLQANINELRKESLQNLHQPNPSQSTQKHFSEQRQKVVNELIHTEQDYLRDLQLCLKHFAEELKNSKVVESEILFGNMKSVVETSSKLLNSFEKAVKGKDPEQQELGKCFVDMSDEIKDVYGQYCRNHDDAIGLLEKYEDVAEAQEVFTKCLNAIRDSTKCWDLSSFLIKPVQRVLKYPLLLNALLKCTPEIHKDKHNLIEATSVMNDVATAINEVKRRKDIVLKYKRMEESGITNKFQKLNWHSVLKKSSRFNQKITQMTGLVSQTVDKQFNENEKKFILLEKALKNLIKNITSYMEQFQETRILQCLNGDNIKEYYLDAATCTEVTLYQSTLRRINTDLLESFVRDVQRLVLSPLNSLLALFQGPQRLIQKRQHKCLDYDSRSNRIDKIKDRDKLKTAKAEVESAKKDYEALNTQLLEELPLFYDQTIGLMKDCILNFMHAKRKFHAVFLGEYTNLMLLSLVTEEGDIVQQQNNKTQEVVERLADLSFIPNQFLGKDLLKKRREARKQPLIPSLPASTGDIIKPSITNRGGSLSRKRMAPQPPPRSGTISGPRNQEPPKPTPRRHTLHSSMVVQNVNPVEITPSNFEPFVAISTFEAQNPGELSVNEGDLLTVQRQCDTSGNSEWWSVTCSGVSGYVPSSFLEKYSEYNEEDDDDDDNSDDDDDYDDVEEQAVKSTPEKEQKQETKMSYYAQFEFDATSPVELSLDEGQIVTVLQQHDLQGNHEWWLVEAEGKRGYVAANFLAPLEEQ